MTDRDVAFMLEAIQLAKQCPRVEGAFSVGAVIVDAAGNRLATGFSRESDPKVHAEEAALAKVLADDPRLKTATIYSTLEPCSQRATNARIPCTELILAAGIPRVVIAWREPSTFVENCVGVERLKASGVDVVELPDFAEAAMAINRHLGI
jgi:pyrimidine deaminase RibD-like protein